MERSAEGTCFHTPEWLESACEVGDFDDASRLYECPDGRQVVLPMLRRPSRIPGLSSEWSMSRGWGFGGPVSSGRLRSEDVATVLRDVLARSGCRTIIKPGPYTDALWGQAPARWRAGPHLVHLADLTDGFADLWSKRFASGMRNHIRKAEKRGVEIEWDTTGKLLEVHYDLYLRWTRRRARERNIPASAALRLAKRRDPLAMYEALARRFGDRCWVGVAWKESEPAASLVMLWNGAHAHYWRGASDRERARHSYASHLLLGRAMEAAAGLGCEQFHMGQSGGVESLMRFKEHLGGERRQYHEYRFEPAVVAGAVRASQHAAREAAALASKGASFGW